MNSALQNGGKPLKKKWYAMQSGLQSVINSQHDQTKIKAIIVVAVVAVVVMPIAPTGLQVTYREHLLC